MFCLNQKRALTQVSHIPGYFGGTNISFILAGKTNTTFPVRNIHTSEYMVTLSIKLRRTHQCRTITGLYCSLFPVDKCSSCPEGWIQHRGKCYHFTNERSSWQKSKKYCSSHGSRLLRIENKEELVGNLPFALFSYIFQTTPAQYLSGGEVGYGYKMKNNTGRVNDFLNCLCSIQNCVPKGDWADLGHQRRSECKFYH